MYTEGHDCYTVASAQIRLCVCVYKISCVYFRIFNVYVVESVSLHAFHHLCVFLCECAECGSSVAVRLQCRCQSVSFRVFVFSCRQLCTPACVCVCRTVIS